VSTETSINRSDFLAIFSDGGAERLNAVLRQRFPKREDRLNELQGMERRGWLVQWDDEEGEGRIVGRKPG
jgi:hypothetical protein